MQIISNENVERKQSVPKNVSRETILLPLGELSVMH